MKNIHVLPTDKPSRLYKSIDDKLSFTDIEFEQSNNFNTNQNIYITSDETAYPYALHYQKEVLKIRAVGENSGELYHDKGFSYPDQCKKIILTTDQDLIKDGVQAIDDEFLEWFVKNPSCERVEVEDISMQYHEEGYSEYKIIIPKEEAKEEMPQIGTKEFNDLASAYFGGKPKQYLEKEMFELEQELDILSHLRWHNSKPKQETLEEIQQRYFKDGFEQGAKWQQERMYSEEDLKEIIYLTWLKCLDANGGDFIDNRNEILEQFKNK